MNDSSQSTPALQLQPDQFERVLGDYGYIGGAISMKRAVAEKFAERTKGRFLTKRTGGLIVDRAAMGYRIVDVVLVDDPNFLDGSCGQVIAICEPM